MKKLILSILILFISTFSYGIIESEFKVIESKNTLDAQNLLLDINKASKSDMLKVGISQSYVDKIIEYRDITLLFYPHNFERFRFLSYHFYLLY